MVKWLGIAAIMAGFLLVLVGLGSDPFAVPFQDYGQMPKEQAQVYARASRASTATAVIGGCTGALGVALLLVGILRQRRREAGAQAQTLDGR